MLHTFIPLPFYAIQIPQNILPKLQKLLPLDLLGSSTDRNDLYKTNVYC